MLRRLTFLWESEDESLENRCWIAAMSLLEAKNRQGENEIGKPYSFLGF